MASTASLVQSPPNPTALRRVRNSISGGPKQVAPPRSSNRRDFLLLFTAATAVATLKAPPAVAQDIPLFGLRKRIEQAEKQTEELVKEGFQAAETAEKGIEAAAVEAEKEIETAAFGLGAPAQAGVVAGAELLGVVVASSIVKGILGPEPLN